MLARVHRSMKDKDQGFTLIELLVVMIIIGILAAIAIPVFLNQRKKAVDSGIKSDLKTAADYEETWYVDHNAYTNTKADFTTGNVKFSSGNTIEVGLGANGFCVRGQNTNSTATGSTYFWYDSVSGGLQSGGAGNAPAGGACAAVANGGFAAVS